MPDTPTPPKRRLLRRILVGLVLLVGVIGLFGFGLIVGRLKLPPYPQLRRMWAQMPHDIKHLVSSSVSGGGQGGTTRALDTNLLVFDVHTFNTFGELGLDGSGGAIVEVDSTILVLDSRGRLFHYRLGGTVERLDAALPMNKGAFEEAVAANIETPALRSNAVKFFRALDLAATTEGGGLTLYALHHVWKAETAERVTTVSRLRMSGLQALLSGSEPATWEVLFEATPAITFDATPFHAMRTNHTGGRLVLDGAGGLLIGLGEQRFDGVRYPQIAAQDDAMSYGKILRLDLASGQVAQYAKGVRNPQGLFLDRDGTLWETEHGPRGGDELNVIERGGNYGWPYDTYGTEEGRYTWHYSEVQGRHDQYTKPVFAWVPSVGISSLTQVDGAPAAWDGDLLVASLAGTTLYRTHVRDGRPLVMEPIPIGDRIRDLEVLRDGTVLIFADNAKLIELHPRPVEAEAVDPTLLLSDAERDLGLDAVLDACGQCHGFGASSAGLAAPSLQDIYGRDIAGTDYGAYSPALRNRDGVWDADALRAYLDDPQAFAPGTLMPDQGLDADATLDALIAFLQRQGTAAED